MFVQCCYPAGVFLRHPASAGVSAQLLVVCGQAGVTLGGPVVWGGGTMGSLGTIWVWDPSRQSEGFEGVSGC